MHTHIVVSGCAEISPRYGLLSFVLKWLSRDFLQQLSERVAYLRESAGALQHLSIWKCQEATLKDLLVMLYRTRIGQDYALVFLSPGIWASHKFTNGNGWLCQ
jgi:hypothetical protein